MRATDSGETISFGLNPLIEASAPLLQLLGRLRNTYSQPNPGDLRERAIQQIRIFEQAARDGGVPMDQLRPAHYALCASLDDVVLNTPWGSAGDWAARSLVSSFHQEVRGGERFFDLLGQLRQNPGTFLPVLELMYLCLSLGFQGRYRLSPRGPAELDRLREDLYADHRAAADSRTDPALAPHWQGVQAPYRPARAVVPTWVLGGRRAGRDRRAVRLVLHQPQRGVRRRVRATAWRAAPALWRKLPAPPRCGRHHPPQALAPGAARTCSSSRRSTRAWSPCSAIMQRRSCASAIRGMFPSGSASVAPGYIHLLERIGEALKAEKGPVHGQRLYRQPADPHGAVSVELPAVRHARGGGARRSSCVRWAIPAASRRRATPMPTRWHPTRRPDGRDQNRRIEVVLRRQG